MQRHSGDQPMQTGSHHEFEPSSYIGSEVENAAAKIQHKPSPVKDITKRPCLPGGPACDDGMDTEALYTFNSLHAWYVHLYTIIRECHGYGNNMTYIFFSSQFLTAHTSHKIKSYSVLWRDIQCSFTALIWPARHADCTDKLTLLVTD